MSATLSQGDVMFPVSAHVRVDRALRMLRALPAGEWWRALWPSTLILALTVALYFVERVEGVRTLRPVFAVLFAGAFVLRTVMLSRWSGLRVESLLAAQGVKAEHGSSQAIVRATFWIGVDLWLWLWLLVLAIYLEPWLVVLVLPSFCLRAALLPSFLASVDAARQDSGFALLRAAMEESDGQRMGAVLAELYLLLGALGLAFNFGALLVAVIGLGQDMLGLDLSFVRAFLSPRNYFALLVLGGSALVCVEPVRATLSALLYVEARLSRDGLALRVLVERCTKGSSTRASLHAIALMVCLALASSAAAQDAGIAFDEADFAEPACDDICERARAGDAEVSRRVDAILRDGVFAEFPDERWDTQSRGLQDLIERFARFFAELSRDEQARSEHPSWVTLPGATFFIVLAALVALLAWYLLSRRRAPIVPEAKPEKSDEDPWARSADEHLRDARKHRDTDLAQALRSLYLATLVGLSRRGQLTLSPERTNGQYLRQLPKSDDRARFSALTRTFDVVQYGRHTPTQDDFEHCLTLAEALVGKTARS